MCNCKNITAQSKECYAQQIEVEIPSHMIDYRNKTIANGRKPTICIDPCIIEEIHDLWSLGVITYGCCCGHNYLEAFVNVDESNIEYMLSIGYEMNHPDKKRKDTFRLTSIPKPSLSS